jgi:hypothetical protein
MHATIYCNDALPPTSEYMTVRTRFSSFELISFLLSVMYLKNGGIILKRHISLLLPLSSRIIVVLNPSSVEWSNDDRYVLFHFC